MSKSFKHDMVEKVHCSVKCKWTQLRNDLIEKKYRYNEVIPSKESAFLSEFNRLFSDEVGRKYFEVLLDNVFCEAIVLRGAKLKPDENIPKADRFIPKAKYIKDDNRFSPARVEWLYLALGYPNDDSGRMLAEKCSQKECRAGDGDRFGICQFELVESNTKVIDLTVGDNWTPQSLQIELHDLVEDYKRRGKPLNADDLMETDVCKRNLIAAYASIMSEELFVPIETSNEQFEYIPFHCIAQYFQSFGYQGIIYTSTMCEGGKNMVLFNKEIANPIESTIDDYIIQS